MDYLVERMREGGCTRLRVVTREEKRDVIDHARHLGAEVVLATPATVTESFAAGMSGLAGDDIVLLGFPDTVWEPRDAFATLVRAVLEGSDVALGLFRIRPADLLRSDVVEVGSDGLVTRIDVKPMHPRSELIWGCAAARSRALTTMTDVAWPGAHFDALSREGHVVRGLPISDAWLDIGTKESIRRAEITWGGGHPTSAPGTCERT
jgi:hypothetical protein